MQILAPQIKTRSSAVAGIAVRSYFARRSAVCSCSLQPCPHCRRKRRDNGDSRRIRRQSHISATVAVFGDKLWHFSATVWTGFTEYRPSIAVHGHHVHLLICSFELKSAFVSLQLFRRLWLNDTYYNGQSEELNMKCHSRNVTVQLSTSDPEHHNFYTSSQTDRQSQTDGQTDRQHNTSTIGYIKRKLGNDAFSMLGTDVPLALAINQNIGHHCRYGIAYR